MAEKKEAGEEVDASKKPIYIKYGLNHISKLCEQKKAQLVVIAHDVDPVEVRARGIASALSRPQRVHAFCCTPLRLQPCGTFMPSWLSPRSGLVD